MGESEKMPDNINDLSFEKALSNLEEIIQRMESGEAPLDNLIIHYQTGIKMLKLCRDKIESAEIKIKLVQEKEGELIEKEIKDLV